ncbi:MAG TPA: aspartyl protease family protein [Saprospiraceae bacterium]|nr:aspartyl protease family protein [Saprospiraceae bacterium]HNT20704.1 aspartyl protease family protein [Saprospiraceae bacterium]
MLAIVFLVFLNSSIEAQSVLNRFQVIGRPKQIDIPFQFENNFILVKSLFNRSFPLNFIFDTGAEHALLFKREYADILGLKYDRRIRLIGADQSEEMYALIARGVSFGLSPTVSYSQDILVLEQDFFHLDEVTGLYVDGIMSSSFFKGYIQHIDYRKRILSFIQPSVFRYNSRKYTKVPVEIINGKLYVTGQVEIQNKKIPVKLLVDSGAGLPLLLYTNANPDFAPPEKAIPGRLGKGLGGYLEGHIGKITELQLEKFKFPNIVTSFQQLDSTLIPAGAEETRFTRDGLLGNQLLSRFDIYIDYNKNLMYLSPIKDLSKEFLVDRSGMEILATGHELKQYIVNSVIPGSPADEAGLKKGDIIKRIGFLSTNILSLEQIIHSLARKPGKKVRIQYFRNATEYKTTVTLRSLI